VGRIETRGFGLGWGPNREERSEREVREERVRGRRGDDSPVPREVCWKREEGSGQREIDRL
jgi:hypothetical protein